MAFKSKESPQKTISFLRLSVLFVGILQLGIGAILYQSTRSFLATAIPTQGEIIAIDRRQNDDTTRYHPVIQFDTKSGETIEFTSDTGFNFSTYQVADNIAILYSQETPNTVRINSFSSLWLPSLSLLGLGGIFTLAMVGSMVYESQQRKLHHHLKNNGKIIVVPYSRVELNSSTKVNSVSPYRIVCQWHDPMDNKVYLFKSENIWFNPEEFARDRDIKIYINPDNYQQYYMNIDFLPKLAT
ncbi:MAG: DUF3592 domain-containing protein [Jaaginema sp. PMC 1079.18]|nr:DUF3592 domain-containing protein [Jaaginema sp. PMC 1080.18]MEC4850594.1 DUF3592 domain-containing protein [Jaaginema sp. PMC 1079.18]MEC4865387.1 DUF3592 domain-containing protein [Jaaginema sp. PMC 1078.18]